MKYASGETQTESMINKLEQNLFTKEENKLKEKKSIGELADFQKLNHAKVQSSVP